MSEVFFVDFHGYDDLAVYYRIAVEKKRYKLAKDLKRRLLNLDSELAKAGEK